MSSYNNNNRVVIVSPTQLILIGLFVTTVAIVLITGLIVWVSSSLRPYEQTTLSNVEEFDNEEDEMMQDPWEIKGLKPIRTNKQMVEGVENSLIQKDVRVIALLTEKDWPLTPPPVNTPCPIYKWPMAIGLQTENEVAEKNKDYTIHCKSMWHLPLPDSTFTWKVNGVFIPPHSTKYALLVDGSLKINRVKQVDAANYSCYFKKGKCYITQIIRHVNLDVIGSQSNKEG